MTETATAIKISENVRTGVSSARDEATSALARLRAQESRLNACSVIRDQSALGEADAIDQVIQGDLDSNGASLPLAGVPVVVKEELDVAGEVTTFGGLANSTPAAADSEIVARLRSAGAVVVAKTTMPEFGAFPYTESTATGITRNPWNTAHTPGGSSGGTAAAVASGSVTVGLGGDGGGSIRIPAAYCGLFGLKPTRGRTSAAPHEHLWWSLGTAGPLSQTVADSAAVYDAISGNLPTDRFQAEEIGSLVDAARLEPGRLRIGWTTKSSSIGVRPHSEHVQAVKDTAKLLAEAGHDVREVQPNYPDPTAVFIPQFFAGIRAEADEVEDRSRLERRTKQTCRMGAWVTDSIRDWAIEGSMKFADTVERVFDGVDVLLTPTTANRPPRTGVLEGRGTLASSLSATPAIAYTAIWNVAGNPAAAVPCGLGSDGLPLSIQLVGRANTEEMLMTLAAQLERERPWPVTAPLPDHR